MSTGHRFDIAPRGHGQLKSSYPRLLESVCNWLFQFGPTPQVTQTDIMYTSSHTNNNTSQIYTICVNEHDCLRVGSMEPPGQLLR